MAERGKALGTMTATARMLHGWLHGSGVIHHRACKHVSAPQHYVKWSGSDACMDANADGASNLKGTKGRTQLTFVACKDKLSALSKPLIPRTPRPRAPASPSLPTHIRKQRARHQHHRTSPHKRCSQRPEFAAHLLHFAPLQCCLHPGSCAALQDLCGQKARRMHESRVKRCIQYAQHVIMHVHSLCAACAAYLASYMRVVAVLLVDAAAGLGCCKITGQTHEAKMCKEFIAKHACS